MKKIIIILTMPSICRYDLYNLPPKKSLFLVNFLYIPDNRIQSIMRTFKLIDRNIYGTLLVLSFHFETCVLAKAYKIKREMFQTKTVWKKVWKILKTNNSFKKYIVYFKIYFNDDLNLLEGGALNG